MAGGRFAGIVVDVKRERWAALALYAAAIFLSLPYTPRVVRWSNEHVGRGTAVALVGLILALALALSLRRLARSRVPAPWPHLALAALALAAAAAGALLCSSPVGLVHLPEYGLLAVLTARAIGGAAGAALGGGAAAAGVGLADELVQSVTPGRVFDWWDVALNAAAALLGGLACAWWRWTGGGRA